MELPVFELIISDNPTDDTEVNYVSLVDMPAIQRDFLAFKRQARFAIQDEEQRIVTGPAMIPDLPIYRRDDNGEYFVVFGAGTIRMIAQKFFLKGYQGNINQQHQADTTVPDSVFFESWLVDRAKGKAPLAGFEDLPDGTWFLTAKINSDDAWAKVKNGEFKGFSVEGMFDYVPLQSVDPEQAVVEKIQSILSIVSSQDE